MHNNAMLKGFFYLHLLTKARIWAKIHWKIQENESCKSNTFYVHTTSDNNTVANRSVEFSFCQRDRNQTIWTIPEGIPPVIQNVFHLPLAWVSGLVSHTYQHETTQAICLYIHITPPYVVLYANWHWLHIYINIFNPVSEFLCQILVNKT